MQLFLFEQHEILSDKLQRVVAKIRNDLKPNTEVIYLSLYKQRQLLSCSNVRKTTNGNSKYS